MQRNSLATKLLCSLVLCLLTIAVIFSSYDAHAIYKGVRMIKNDDGQEIAAANTYDTAGCSSDYDKCKCSSGTIGFDPFGKNDDINWELSNPVCITYSAVSGATLLALEVVSSNACLQPSLAAEAALSAASGVPLSPAMLKRRAQEATKCTVFLGKCFNPPFATCALAAACCGGMTAAIAGTGVAVAALSIIWDQARISFQNGRICGSPWQKWSKTTEDGKERWTKVKGPYHVCLENLFLNNSNSCGLPSLDGVPASSTSLSNKYYRELIYGGMEFNDNGDNACGNPSSWDHDKRIAQLGYDSEFQRYYMTGPATASVYACHRFVTTDRKDQSVQQAYDCCKRRSQNAICIENKTGLGDVLSPYDYEFCELGSRCSVANIVFETYGSTKQSNYICAKTYSVCPYNHLLGGGTEEKKTDLKDLTQVQNFCQFMNHCSKIPILPYIRTTSFEGGFISSACRDMKGDSQNVYGYTSQLIPINTKGFSAPMAQCFKETMENIFLHKAGDTKCFNPDELPTQDGVCVSGYIYKKGGDLPGKSFFLKIQDNLQELLKMCLVFSIIGFGIAILFAVPGEFITRKQLLPFILKIGLVMYFAVGDGWQFGFMQGVLGASSYLSDMTFKIDEDKDLSKLDGCQFPRFNYADQDEDTKYQTTESRWPSYPPTKEYLRTWDTLDCKIARALGFGPEVSVPNLIFMILGGFLTGGLGIVFVIASFFFAFFLISVTIRALHIFLISTTAVVILMYVSPITITLGMFARTKGIFEKWWKELLGYTLQPMILFAYLGVLLTLFDSIVIGEATFTPTTVKIGGRDVVDVYGRIAPKQINCSGTAVDNSIYCIFRIADIKTFPGLEVLGVGLPMLASMNSVKLESIIKAAFLMFIFAKFMDQISGFAAKLVGGTALASDWNVSAVGMAKKSFDTMRSIQQRGMNTVKKHGGTVARAAGEKARSAVNAVGNKGKSVAEIGKSGGQDSVATTTARGQDSAAVKDAGGQDSGAQSAPDGTDSAAKGKTQPEPKTEGQDSPGDTNPR